VLARLQLWLDPLPRPGPENMAIDEWLAEICTEPILRSYAWEPGWGSFGYFVKRAELPGNGLQWVRRWTGGGIVDHRADWTYTLFIPRGHALAEARGAESYRTIHAALASALGTAARLAEPTAPAAGGDCFTQPVEHDILDPAGSKIAGAGQRRNARGLLHQGSVQGVKERLAAELATRLTHQIETVSLTPDPAWLAAKCTERYANDAWTARR
jgi:lipoate-protein ligase A